MKWLHKPVSHVDNLVAIRLYRIRSVLLLLLLLLLLAATYNMTFNIAMFKISSEVSYTENVTIYVGYM